MNLRHLVLASVLALTFSAAAPAQEGKFVPAPPELKQLVSTLPKPAYPPSLARGARPEGTVVIRMYVEESGQISQKKVVKSSGSADLDKAAIDATKPFKFTPYAVKGKNIAWFFDYSASYKAPGKAEARSTDEKANAAKQRRPDY